LKEPLGYALIVVLVLLGIVQVQFGNRLLKLSNNLDGMLKPFCYANMATGILLATVVLIPLSIPVSALSDLMLGTIFFNMSKNMKERQRIEGAAG
jgi:peptidoglycan biosynthesis protein MviN/MurJ (putative lipid II flippase)